MALITWIVPGELGSALVTNRALKEVLSLSGVDPLVDFNGFLTSLSSLNASNLGSGLVPTARLGSGSANAATVLYGNNTWGTIPGGTPYRVYNPRDYGATGDGVTNDTTAILACQTAANADTGAGSVIIMFPPGIYLTNGGAITIGTSDKAKIWLPQGIGAVRIKSASNGLVFNVNAASEVNIGDFVFLRNSTTGYTIQYSGITTDCRIGSIRINAAVDHGVKFGIDSGNNMICSGIVYDGPPAGAAVAQIGINTQAIPMEFSNIQAGQSLVFSVEGVDNFLVNNAWGRNWYMGAASSKVTLTNIRLGSLAATIYIRGINQSITGCIFGGPIDLDAALNGCTIEGNVVAGAITDNSTPGNNHIDLRPTGGDPTLFGNRIIKGNLSIGTSPASIGVLRLPNNQAMYFNGNTTPNVGYVFVATTDDMFIGGPTGLNSIRFEIGSAQPLAATSAGVTLKPIVSVGSQPAGSGTGIRLSGNTDMITSRTVANDGDVVILGLSSNRDINIGGTGTSPNVNRYLIVSAEGAFQFLIADGSLQPGTDNVFDLGTGALRLKNGYFGGTIAATTLTGAGSGITALNASNLASGTVPTARLGTGTANSTTYLRGDGTWNTPAGGGGAISGSGTNGTLTRWTGASTLGDSAGIVNADVSASAAIARSKLALTNTILNADIVAAAGIPYSKLTLTTSIVNGDISASAAIVDTKLATIATAGKVSNSATTAVSTNTASKIVTRDVSGNFAAGVITVTGLTSTGIVITPASTTGTTGLRLPHGIAPTTPVNGDIWTTTTGVFAQVNGATLNCTLSGLTLGTIPKAGSASNLVNSIITELSGLITLDNASGALAVGQTTATAGRVRLPNNGSVQYRNAGNTANVIGFKLGSDDKFYVGTDSDGTQNVSIVSNGHLSWYADATFDIGVSASANRPRVAYLSSAVVVGTNPSTTGAVRLANATTISARNAANSADVSLVALNSGNTLVLGGTNGAVTLACDGAAQLVLDSNTLYPLTANAFDLGDDVQKFKSAYFDGVIKAGGVTGATMRSYAQYKSAPAISSGTLTLDYTAGPDFVVSLNANITTMTITNWPASGVTGKINIHFVADGTLRTIAYDSAFKSDGGTAPIPPSTSGYVHSVSLISWDGKSTGLLLLAAQACH